MAIVAEVARWLVLGSAIVTLGTACGDDDDDQGDDRGRSQGGGVGSACEEDSDCTGYDHPACNQELLPLASIINDEDHPDVENYRNWTLDFPGGYCANRLDTPCADDGDCGAGAGCFKPFDGYSQTERAELLDELGALGLPFDVDAFASTGLCYARCDSDEDCAAAEGYECIVPLSGFMAIINAAYDRTFCTKFRDVQDLLVSN